MKIAIIGATGGTGREVLRQALERGHQVTAHVRQAGSLTPQPGLNTVIGTLEDARTLRRALTGVDAVLCCLGPKANLQQMLNKQTLMREGVSRITAQMKAAGIRCLVLLSAHEAGDWQRTVGSPLTRFLLKTVTLTAFEDKQASEQELVRSGLAWTGVYPVFLTNGPLTGQVEVQPHARVGPRCPTRSRYFSASANTS
jgi:uncharacterized protein YbjT (DUF2867 family)